MNRLQITAVLVLKVCLFVFSIPAANADEPSPVEAETKMVLLLEAIKNKDHKKFIQPGNQAFKEMNGAWQFDSHVMNHHVKISQGYKLEYLGSIKRLGMREYIWRVSFPGEKYEKRGSVSISKYGKVVGFDLF